MKKVNKIKSEHLEALIEALGGMPDPMCEMGEDMSKDMAEEVEEDEEDDDKKKKKSKLIAAMISVKPKGE